MNRNKKKVTKVRLACDFETVVTGDKHQDETSVWLGGGIDLEAENKPEFVRTVGSIEDFFEKYLYTYKCKTIAYFHNEKFDGSFILDYLLKNGYSVSKIIVNDEEKMSSAEKDLKNNEFVCLISTKGIWYTIKIKHKSHIYEIRDSYKLLPFSLKKIGKDFQTEHQKLEMEYLGERYPNCPVSDDEIKYFQNDCLVLKEALNIAEEHGLNKLTIASCCMSEFKSQYHPAEFAKKFPNLYGDNFRLPENVFGYSSAGDYIRASYHGGWTYLRDDRANILYEANIDFNGKKIAGTTCDVNSLYPSKLVTERYPVYYPHFFKGEVPKDVLDNKELYYFVRVKTRFYLKPDHLPTIQIKGSMFYPPREWLKSSDYIDNDGNSWKRIVDDVNGGYREMIPTMVLTCTDWELMQDHYNLEDTEILDGCWFYTEKGMFDSYIYKYFEIKKKSKGAVKAISKLRLNSLYGKFSTSTDASRKIPYLSDDGVVHFTDTDEVNIKKAGAISIGSACTSYSRNFTIRAAQMNYDAFCYGDTDSMHLLCSPDDVKGAPEDPVELDHWKYEACWDSAIFVRAKTYVEHVTHENREEVKSYYNIKCAGMPDRAKNNFESKLVNEPLKDDDNLEEYEAKIGIKHLTDDEIAFHKKPKMTLKDFKENLCVPGSLKPKRIIGGIVLLNGDYVMRPQMFRKKYY